MHTKQASVHCRSGTDQSRHRETFDSTAYLYGGTYCRRRHCYSCTESCCEDLRQAHQCPLESYSFLFLYSASARAIADDSGHVQSIEYCTCSVVPLTIRETDGRRPQVETSARLHKSPTPSRCHLSTAPPTHSPASPRERLCTLVSIRDHGDLWRNPLARLVDQQTTLRITSSLYTPPLERSVVCRVAQRGNMHSGRGSKREGVA